MARWIKNPNGQRFINPYSFVGLGSDLQRAIPTDGELTGKITVRLLVKTPLAIPDSENVITERNGHKRYRFYTVNGEPVIPGSQLRGLIRSAYETLSNSCFSVNNNNILSARHTDPAHPGLVQYKDGAWHLYQAHTKKDRGQAINARMEVRRTWYPLKKDANLKTKVFCVGTEEECDDLSKSIEEYHENLKIYNSDGSRFKKQQAQLTYGIRADGGLYPVFYEIVNRDGKRCVYLSPSQIGRYVFGKTLDDLLGTHKSCSKQKLESDPETKKAKPASLCKTCALFGTISNIGGQAFASRIRFSDAYMSKPRSMKTVTLKELASPKPTSVEFYSKRPDGALYWSYDYKITSYERVRVNDRTQYIPQKEACDVSVRGRKFYLHNPHLRKTDYSTTEKTKRNSTMELCENGEFTFDIFFEKITEQQLHELVWAVTIGDNKDEGTQMHKFGHGKPLGLGSVKLVVSEIHLRSFNLEGLKYNIDKKTKDEIEDYVVDNPFISDSSSYEDKRSFGEFMLLTDFYGFNEPMKNKKADISYPVADDVKGTANSKASHQWFIANRSMGRDGTPMSWSVKYTLPTADESDVTLPALILTDGNRRNNNPNTRQNNRNNNQNTRQNSGNRGNNPYYSDSNGSGFGMGNIKIKKK